MPKLQAIILKVSDPQTQQRFYSDVLGMTLDENDLSLGYAETEARLIFNQTDSDYQLNKNDLYWKITVAVPNIELACSQLAEMGVSVTKPRQFHQVGYLAHFTDPAGFSIELIDHWFKGNRASDHCDPRRLGGGAHLNLLTLRTTDIERVVRYCASWGMKLLCVQAVPGYNFTLYFFAFTDEAPPSSDLHAIENREWLYQRPYTALEIQHLHDDSSESIVAPAAASAGYAGALIADHVETIENNELRIYSI